MNPQPTLQTLPIDCLIEISSYLSLPECMFLRSSSRQLKAAVDEHFRTGVGVLPVLLSARYSPESVAFYDEYCQQEFKYSEQYEKFTYGSTSGVSQLEVYDDKVEYKLEDYEAQFRFENFLVLFDLAKFGGYMDFITKYLPGVTKLALIIDHEEHMNNVPTILNLYRKQLKVLFVERTARSVFEVEYNDEVNESCPEKIVEVPFYRNSKLKNMPEEFYQSIDGLEALEELHFFAKAVNINRFKNERKLEDKHFLKRMLHRLKVFHFKDYYNECPYEPFDIEYFSSEVYKNLEKVICNDFAIEMWLKASFPRLETLVLNGGLIDDLEPEKIPSLRMYCQLDVISLGDDTMEFFNMLPKMERIHCREMYPFEEPTVVNRSIKFIEIELLQSAELRKKYSDEEALKELKECLRCFHGLEKVIVREPFMEFTGNDLLRIHE